MSSVNYSFTASSSSTSIYNPVVINFLPSGITLAAGEFLSKIVYALPDITITKVNTFVSNALALTPQYKDIDCRAPLQYTLAGETSGTSTISISAFVGPYSLSAARVYSLTVNNLLPSLTKNPIGVSTNAYAFEEVHLIRTRAWGVDNKQMFLLETKSPTYLLVNYTD
jgi:hypothetical protein